MQTAPPAAATELPVDTKLSHCVHRETDRYTDTHTEIYMYTYTDTQADTQTGRRIHTLDIQKLKLHGEFKKNKNRHNIKA